MSAFAAYQAESPAGKSWALAAFVSSLFNSTAPPPTGTEDYRNGKYTPYIGLALGASIATLQSEEGVPNAYLKYIVLDQDSLYVYSDVQVISSSAKEGWQELKLHYKVEQDGFVQVFVYNESGQEVFFDDITIRKDPALIVQENHYEPWGMNLVGIEKLGKPDHKYLYNGKEKQEEFDLNWNDYGARFYDPQLGRWNSVDPMTESQEGWTPYHYVYANPVLRIDPDGRCPDGDCPGISVAGILENTVKDLAVSVGNVAMMGSGPVNNAYRFSRDENGNIQLGYRGYGSSTKEALSFIGSDLLDGANVAATFGTGGVGGAGLLMARTGGKAIITNAFVQGGKSSLKSLDKLIGPAGDAGAIVTKQIPGNWMQKTAKKGAGTRFIDPSNTGNNIRVMRGDEASPFSNSQKPYTIRYIDGKPVDKSKKVIPTPTGKGQNKEERLHVPVPEFKF
jgi:RHS repeat-associated protein